MYRKIIFIAINLFTLTSFAKVTILLMIAGFAYLLTVFGQPFNYKELNKMEEYSLLSAMATLFSGALYVCDVNDTLKAISFAAIILINIAFIITWFASLMNIAFQAHLGKLQHYFPSCTYSVVAFLIALEQTKKTLNICKYFQEVRKNYAKIKINIVTTYEGVPSGDNTFSTVLEKKESKISQNSKLQNIPPTKKEIMNTKVINIK